MKLILNVLSIFILLISSFSGLTYADYTGPYDLVVDKSVHSYDFANQTISYNLAFANNGAGDITDGYVSDIIPDGLIYSGTISSTVSYDSVSYVDIQEPNLLYYEGIDLLSSQSGEIVVEFTYASGTDISTLVNESTIGVETDSCQPIQTGTEEVTHTSYVLPDGTLPGEPSTPYDLSIEKINLSPGPFYDGDSVTYQINVCYSGSPDVKDNIYVEDVFPETLEFQFSTAPVVPDQVTDTKIIWRSFPLAPESCESFTATFTVKNIYQDILNTANIGSTDGFGLRYIESIETNQLNNTAQESISGDDFDLSIVKTIVARNGQTCISEGGTADCTVWSGGDTITYSLAYTLDGADRDDIAVLDTLGGNSSYLSSSEFPSNTLNGNVVNITSNPDDTIPAYSSRFVVWQGLSLSNGQTKTIDLEVQLPNGSCSNQSIPNTAYVTLDGADSGGYIFPLESAVGNHADSGLPENPDVIHLYETRERNILDNSDSAETITIPIDPILDCAAPSTVYDLSIEKTVHDDDGIVYPGQLVDYTLTYTNSGAAHGKIYLDDTFDADKMEFVGIVNSGTLVEFDQSEIFDWWNSQFIQNQYDQLYPYFMQYRNGSGDYLSNIPTEGGYFQGNIDHEGSIALYCLVRNPELNKIKADYVQYYRDNYSVFYQDLIAAGYENQAAFNEAHLRIEWEYYQSLVSTFSPTIFEESIKECVIEGQYNINLALGYEPSIAQQLAENYENDASGFLNSHYLQAWNRYQNVSIFMHGAVDHSKLFLQNRWPQYRQYFYSYPLTDSYTVLKSTSFGQFSSNLGNIDSLNQLTSGFPGVEFQNLFGRPNHIIDVQPGKVIWDCPVTENTFTDFKACVTSNGQSFVDDINVLWNKQHIYSIPQWAIGAAGLGNEPDSSEYRNNALFSYDELANLIAAGEFNNPGSRYETGPDERIWGGYIQPSVSYDTYSVNNGISFHDIAMGEDETGSITLQFRVKDTVNEGDVMCNTGTVASNTRVNYFQVRAGYDYGEYNFGCEGDDLIIGYDGTNFGRFVVTDGCPSNNQISVWHNILSGRGHTNLGIRSETIVFDNNRDEVCVTVGELPPEMSVTKSIVGSTSYDPGDTVTFSIEACNDGSTSIANMYVTEEVPNGMIYVPGSVTAAEGTQLSGQPEIKWDIGSVAAGSCKTITPQFTISPETGADELENIARVSSLRNGEEVGDVTAINNASDVIITINDTGFASVPIVPEVPVISKTAEFTGDGTPGDTVTYTLSITNDNSEDAVYTITDTAYTGLVFVSADSILGVSPVSTLSGSQTITEWIGVDVPAGDTITAEIEFTIDGSSQGGDELINNLKADRTIINDCVEGETDVSNNTDTVILGSCGAVDGTDIYNASGDGSVLTGGSTGLCANGEEAESFVYSGGVGSGMAMWTWTCDGFTECSATELSCGDSIHQAGYEQCDDGNSNNNDDCLDSCMISTCGDGYTWNEGAGTEACDDADSNNQNDCLNDCTVPTCGDGYVWDEGTGSEECDDMNSLNEDNCKNDCTLNVCGDGVTGGPGEACDDENLFDTDACYSAGSVNGTECSFTSCGDSVTQMPNGFGDNEECDPGMLCEDGTTDCTMGGVSACSGIGGGTCSQLSTSVCLNSCIYSYCGDGVVQNVNGVGSGGLTGIGDEQCDNGGANSDTTPDACRTSCVLPTCGDGIVDTGAGEACDDGDGTLNNGNGVLFDGCDTSCQIETCELDGYVYIDTNLNDQYDSGIDTPIENYEVNAIFTAGGIVGTMMTDSDGYYEFTGLDCTQSYDVMYTNPGAYVSDSAQNEQVNQQGTPSSITAPATDFGTGTQYESTNNNFGLIPAEECISASVIPAVGYDTLQLTSVSCEGAGTTSYLAEILDDTGAVVASYSLSSTTEIQTTVALTGGLALLSSGDYTLRCTAGSTTNSACETPIVVEYCGDGSENGTEACDDGNDDNDDLCDTGGTSPNSNGICTLTYCGDGVVQNVNGVGMYGVTGIGDEACDDGANGDDTDGCTDTCTLTYCGDNVVQNTNGVESDGQTGVGDEQCDEGEFDTETCYGESGGPNGENACTFTVCGDSVVQQPNGNGQSEGCDEGLNTTGTCYGPNDTPSGYMPCSYTTCGDGIVQSSNGVGTGGTTAGGDEECDDGNDDEFDNCTSSCVEQLCMVDGYIYLDVADNDLYNIGVDTVLSGMSVALSNGDTTVTDIDGYYEFVGLDCTQDYDISYTNSSIYYSDSAQFEYDTQESTGLTISVDDVSFQSEPHYQSVDNNFGLTLYDLGINKTVNGVDTTVDGPILNWNTTQVEYVLTINNEGPTTAYDITVEDTFIDSDLDIVSYDLGALSGVSVVETSSSLAIGPISHLAAGDEYQVTITANTYGISGHSIINTASVYTNEGAGDPIENIHTNGFTNNTYQAEVIIEEICSIQGYLYEDINNTDEFDNGDGLLSNVTVSVEDQLGGSLNVLGGAMTTTTNGDGWYSIGNLDCSNDYTVTYDVSVVSNTLLSAQFEQSTQQSDPNSIVVLSSAFDEILDVYGSYSPNNNFGFDQAPAGRSSSITTVTTEPVISSVIETEPEEVEVVEAEIEPEISSVVETAPEDVVEVEELDEVVDVDYTAFEAEVAKYKEQIEKNKEAPLGVHGYNGPQKYLQTGLTVEEGMSRYGIRTILNRGVATNFPSRGKAAGGDYTKDLDYWLENVLLPYDPEAEGRDMYVLIPQAGYLIPIQSLPEDSAEYGSMLLGKNISVEKQLQEEFALGGLHHPGSVLPGMAGKSIAAFHSSWFEDVPLRYIEGKYPTIGQVLVTVESGDEIIYYVRNDNGEYDMYEYEVNEVVEVSPSETEHLYPSSGYEAMLYTCTDFGASDNRLVVNMSMVNQEDLFADEKIVVDTSLLGDEYKEQVDRIFDSISLLNSEERLMRLNNIWNIVNGVEVNNFMLEQLITYIKYKIILEF